MPISLTKLVARPDLTEPDGQSVLSYLRDGDGNSIASTGGALHVVQQGTVTVQATDLDIRNLVFATDKVDVSGSSNVAVTDGGGSLTVDATDLDIRDLSSVSDSVTAVLASTKLEDAAHVSGDAGQFMLAVRNDAGTSLVSADGDYAPFQVDASGALRVSGTLSLIGQYAEDSAHVSGNTGIYNLAVRSDAPAIATSADGDYASQTVDAYNRQWANTGSNVSMSNASASVTTTSALLIAASAGRRKIIAQNVGSKKVFVGASGVSTANGLVISPGASIELEIGPALALHAVAENGTQDVRCLQTA